MTKIINLCFALVGTVALVNAQYGNSPAKYAVDMECGNCIRSGNDFCIYNVAENATTIHKWNCSSTPVTPEWNVQKFQPGVLGSWMCSKGYTDQMNAIVNGCRPQLNQGYGLLAGFCGPYFIDLTKEGAAVDGRTII